MSRPTENLTRAAAQRRAALLADLGYDVTLDLTSADRFRSRSEVTFTCHEPGSDTFIDITAASIAHAELNGRALPIDDFDGVRLRLHDLAASNRLVVEAEHRYSKDGTGMHAFVDPVDGHRYLHTQSEPNHAHLFYTCFDQPDLKGRFRFEVTAPEDWTVVSNAPTDGPPTGDGGPRTWRFARTRTMSPYLTAVVAGPYHAHHDRDGDIALGLYCRRSLAEHLETEEIIEITRQGLDLFPELFDTPYVWGKYDQLFVPEFSSGAMENAGCVTFNESYLFRSKVTEAHRLRRAETILHEMAHMWFGDLVTMRWWDDLWLNESFATYASYYALEHATRFSNAWVDFNDSLKAWAKYQDQMPTTHPIEADVPDVEAVHQNFDGITYAKGASVLRQLAAWIGEDDFFAGCADYFAEHAYGNATLHDFLGSLEKASARDLGTWADTWLRTAGVNTIGVVTEHDGETYERVTVTQSAPGDHPTLRPHRLGVGLYRLVDDRLVRQRRVELDVAGAATEVPQLSGAPVSDLILPNDGDLAYTKLRLDDLSLRTLTTHLHTLDDGLARTLCWGSAWDMVRDGQLAASGYVDLVMGNAEGESDVGLLRTALDRARTAAELYGAPSRRAGVLARLHEHARGALERAQPGSDPQLTWARHWASTARSSQHAAEVARLLNGEATVPGLVVDKELTWHLLGCLARADAVDDAAIEAQLDADPTDLGERHAARIRASRPTPEAKAEAWRLVVEEDELSHTQADEIARGMRQYDQAELLEPYVERYVEALPQLWARHSTERAIELTQLLYPLAVVEQDTVDLTDRAIASATQPACVRELREMRDTLTRALRAREVDRAATTSG